MADHQYNHSIEVWKDIAGFPGYEVSDQGRVRSYWNKHAKLNSTPHLLKPQMRNNYLSVLLHKDRKPFHKVIHGLVLLVFKGPRPMGMQGCHNDGININVSLRNLRWDTPLSNYRDRDNHGKTRRGIHNGNAKLDESKVKHIRSLHNSGITYAVISNHLSISQSTISQIIRGITWRHII